MLAEFVTARSPPSKIESVSVAELLPETGSLVFAGVATLAVFDSEPLAFAANVPFTVIVALPPIGKLTVVLMLLPLPLGAVQVEPVGAVHVQVTPLSVAGTLSVTVARLAAFGPALDTVIVYCTAEPGLTVVTPSVLETDRSALRPGNSSAPMSKPPRAGRPWPSMSIDGALSVFGGRW